jgi:hypothetical protein
LSSGINELCKTRRYLSIYSDREDHSSLEILTPAPNMTGKKSLFDIISSDCPIVAVKGFAASKYPLIDL